MYKTAAQSVLSWPIPHSLRHQVHVTLKKFVRRLRQDLLRVYHSSGKDCDTAELLHQITSGKTFLKITNLVSVITNMYTVDLKLMTTIQESIHQHWCDHTDHNIVLQNIMSFDVQMAAVSITGKKDIDNYSTVSLNKMRSKNINDHVPNSNFFSDFLGEFRNIDDYVPNSNFFSDFLGKFRNIDDYVPNSSFFSDFINKFRYTIWTTPWRNMPCNSSGSSTNRS